MATRRAKKKKTFFTPRRKRDLGVFALFIFGVLPGLYAMWTRTRWPKSTKLAISVVSLAVLFAIMAPLTNPPERVTGGVVLVGTQAEAEIYGPEAPANRAAIEVFTPIRTAIVLESTAEPEPVYVFCNDGGKYYHGETCRYVKPNTPKVTISRALDAGYTRCPECDAPDGTGY